jgi:hypothetical protein
MASTSTFIPANKRFKEKEDKQKGWKANKKPVITCRHDGCLWKIQFT